MQCCQAGAGLFGGKCCCILQLSQALPPCAEGNTHWVV